VPELPGHGLSSVDLDAGVAAADLVAIVTAHPEVDHEAVVAAAALAIDFRGVTRGIDADNLIRL
jgi:UDP-N-acetyl-D-glucosamine dehydrogenase